jgi:cyclic pyranopterin phosphate synthase
MGEPLLMQDRFGRTIDYLRISVTDRCDLRCSYCLPPGEARRPPQRQFLTDDEITHTVASALDLGIGRVRLTGGEPLLRSGIVRLVARLAKLPNLRDFALTTNGMRLNRLAAPLCAAGLRRVNVHLDTLDPVSYRERTGGGELPRVLAGLGAARRAGLSPIKLNCVVVHDSDEPDARRVAEYGREHGYPVRFIRRMHLDSGVFGLVEGGNGGDCPRCDRLRLTSDGWLKPCLFSDLAFDLRGLGARAAIQRATAAKPRSGTVCRTHGFHAIGG